MNQNPENQKSQNAMNEEKILQFWRDNNIFQKTLEKESPAGDYNFFEGPPTANGRPGIHHVMARSFKDIIPRYKTMRGFRVGRKAGWDTHGLPVELQVEKKLGLKSKKEIEQYGVAAFNTQCRESVWQYKDEWEKLTDRMGYWLDMSNPYITYDNSYIESLWGLVKKIDERGHMYRDFRVGPWCTRCGTGLSSHELNQPGAYKDVKDVTAYVKFKIVGTDNGYFVAWTTTPWTLPGNVALAVGADIDYVEAKVSNEILVIAKERLSVLGEGYEIIAEHKGSEMVGMKYEPLYPFMIDALSLKSDSLAAAYQVYAADFVTTTDGTGIVHIAPMYGADDFELGTKHNLPKFHTVNEEGKFISGTAFLEGRYVKESDEGGKPTLAIDIINDLTDRGLLFKKENYSHSYPHCWRCDTPLLYYARTSWYFRMSALRDQLLAANKNIHWEPKHIQDGRFGEWLDNIKDWAISRDRYWGTPIPVWETPSGKRVVIGGIDDIKKYSKKSGNTYFVMRHGEGFNNVEQFHTQELYKTALLTETGERQVVESIGAFKEKIDLVISSPFERTKQTAEIVCNKLDIPFTDVIYDDRAGEWKTSIKFENAPKDEFRQYYNADYRKDPFEKLPEGESFAEAVQRVGSFIYDLDSKYQNQNIFIVGHSGMMRALEFVVNGYSFSDMLDENILIPPGNAEIRAFDFVPLPHNEQYELDFHKPYIDDIKLELDGEPLVRTPEVMDVWFDSGAMPYAQNHTLGAPVNFQPQPADYISEGVDQTRGWFYTMHAIANLVNDTPTNNYHNVICLGLLMDANGQKMSKSKGNVVDPWDMFDRYGADVIRFWIYSVNAPGESKNFDEKSLDEVRKKVFNPLLNVVSFYELFRDQNAEEKHFKLENINVLDSWIMTRLFMLTREMTESLDAYNITDPARALREFIDDLSTWYLRRSRDRIKDGDAQTKQVLYFVLTRLTKLLAPFAPFTAEEIHQKLRHDGRDAISIHITDWPDYITDDRMNIGLERMDRVRKLVTLGLEARQRVNIKVRQPLASITISESLPDGYLEILKDELNVKSVVVNENLAKGIVEIDTVITDDLRDEGDMREIIRKIQDMRKDANLLPSDRVVVYLIDTQPQWLEKFKDELLGTVGATEIVWGSENNKVEK